jgi:hypothetical protein
MSMKVTMRSRLFDNSIVIAFILLTLCGTAQEAFAAPLNILPNNLPDADLNGPYSQSLTGTGGSGNPSLYTWTLAGALPTGLVFTPSGLTATISGTTSVAGSYPFTITLSDSTGSHINTYSIKVSVGGCYFTGAATGGISFSTIDPSTTPGPILGTVTQQVNFICKNTFPYTVTANPASGWTMVSGGNALAYTPGFIANGIGTGAAAPLFTNTSLILQGDYMNAVAGLYVNTQPVNFTVKWTGGGGGSIVATLPAGSVSGTVISTCAVSQSPGTLTFSIDPSVAGTTSATITPDMQIKCTKNTTVSISALSACGGLDSSYPLCGGILIPYTFNCLPSVMGQGFATGISLNIGGTAASANYENAPVGSYGDLQTLTITY